MSENAPSTPRAVSKRSPWRSVSLWVAVAITVLGLGLWGYAAASKPKPTAQGTDNINGMVSGFANDPMAARTATPPEERLIDTASPAVARFGGCFIAGFCIAYAFKKFIKVTALLVGVFLITMFALQKAGVIHFEWAWIEDGLERSVAWIKGEAGAMKEFVLGYLPSTASAVAGMAVGLRKG